MCVHIVVRTQCHDAESPGHDGRIHRIFHGGYQNEASNARFARMRRRTCRAKSEFGRCGGSIKQLSVHGIDWKVLLRTHTGVHGWQLLSDRGRLGRRLRCCVKAYLTQNEDNCDVRCSFSETARRDHRLTRANSGEQ